LLANCSAAKASQAWTNDDTLSSQYNTPVIHQGYLFGIHGREDQGVAALRCVELATGKPMWSENEYGVAHILLAGDKILILKNDGWLTLASASPAAFKPLAKARVSEHLTRALPALAQGRLYVRDLAGSGGQVHCLEVGPDSAPSR
jgi:hypothetical protein